MSFIEHLSWQRFQVITTGHVAIGGACIAESAILDRSRNDVYFIHGHNGKALVRSF